MTLMKPILFGWALATGLSLAFAVVADAADLAGPVPDKVVKVMREGNNAPRRCSAHGYRGDFWHPLRQAADRWPPDGRNNRFDAMTTQFLVQGGILICGEMPDWPSVAGPEELRGANGFSWDSAFAAR
jgi:hypothetical protein